MSSTETAGSGEVKKPDGERWLELLDRGDLVGTPIPYFVDGRQLNAEEFPLLDGKHVLPIFTAIESLAPDNPKREEYIEAARSALDYYLAKPVEGQ